MRRRAPSGFSSPRTAQTRAVRPGSSASHCVDARRSHHVTSHPAEPTLENGGGGRPSFCVEIVRLGLIPFGTTSTAGILWTQVSCRNLPHPRHGSACPRLTLNLTRFFAAAQTFFAVPVWRVRRLPLNTHFHKISVELFLHASSVHLGLPVHCSCFLERLPSSAPLY